MKLAALKKIYFIGIGGIGMSALARFFLRNGTEIIGYDKTETTLTKKLVREGMKIHYEDEVSMIPEGVDLVVYTPAIPKDHKELNHFKNEGFEILKRSEVLGLISREKKCIAIAGTHGKTTTSSMTAHLLKSCGIDISCFLGGIANNFDSNYCYGESEWTVIEADEFDRSFHTLSPEISILISMDPDHLDIYGAKDKMQESFEIFLSKINEGGKVIMHEDLLGQFERKFIDQLKSKNIEIFKYGQHNNDFKVTDLRFVNGKQVFNFNEMEDLELALPGDHNTENMAAAIAIAKLLGIEDEKIKTGVKTFSGIKRRFDISVGKEVTYIDDYAHHPSELKASIGSAKKLWPDMKLTVIFQPHLFSRTKDFMDDFAKELSQADELLLMEIYPARELPINGITSSVLLEKIDIEKKELVQRDNLMNVIKDKPIEILMTLGAGDIDIFAPLIRDWIK